MHNFVCLEPKRIKPDVTRPAEVVLDYWEPARKHLLGDPKLIQRLLEFDKDNVDPRVVEVIVASFINNPLFNPEVIRKVRRWAPIDSCVLWAQVLE